MKRLINLFVIIFMFFNYSCSTNKIDSLTVDKVYYDNNSIKAIISKKDDNLHGVSIYYDVDSNIINKVNYMNNLLHGEWIEYFNDGKVKYRVIYNYGLKDGSEIWFYDNGKVKSEAIYDNGELVSEILRWDYDGNIIIK